MTAYRYGAGMFVLGLCIATWALVTPGNHPTPSFLGGFIMGHGFMMMMRDRILRRYR